MRCVDFNRGIICSLDAFNTRFSRGLNRSGDFVCSLLRTIQWDMKPQSLRDTSFYVLGNGDT